MADDPNGAGGPPPDFMISPKDYDALVRTVIGEAGGEPDVGKVGVAHVILNRVASGQYPSTVTGVVNQPGQFEAVDTRGAQLAAIPTDDPRYRSAARAVDMAISGKAPDPTSGALNFYAPQLQADLGRAPPAWGNRPSIQIGKHVFSGGTVGQAPSAVGSATPAEASGDISADDLDTMLSGGARPASGGQGGVDAAPPGTPPAASDPDDATRAAVARALIQHVNGAATGGGAPVPTAGGAGQSLPGPSAAQGASAQAGSDDGTVSADDLDAMLSGGAPRPLTIHGAGNARPSTVTPAVGPFGGLDRGAFGSAAADASAAAAAKTADVVPYLPGADRSQAAATAPPMADGAQGALDAVEGTGPANYRTGGPEDGLTPWERLKGMPELGVDMVREAGQAVPFLGATVNPLAAHLAAAVTGRSLEDTTATGNALAGQFEADHPGLTMASRLAGGAAVLGPVAEAAPWAFGIQKGANLATRMATSGATNALLAAGDAEVRGEDPTSGGYVGNALRYGLGFAAPALGGIGGGATKVAGNALGAVYDRAANLAGGPHAWSGVGGYGSAAVDYLLNKIAADGGVGAAADRLGQLGPEGMIADTGPSTQGVVGGLSKLPGPAKSVTASALEARHDGRTGRILSDVDAALGPAQSPTPWRQAVEDAGAAVTEPYFARAYAAGAPWTPELDALSQRPAVRSALTEAATDAANRGTPLPGVTLDAAGNPVAAGAPLAAYEAGQRPAVTAALADALGVDPAAGPLAIGDRIAAQRSAAADPAYQAYRSMPAVSTSPELAELLSRPSGRAAVALAERKAADQGRSIYVPRPEPEGPAPTAGAGPGRSGRDDIPDATEGLGQGPGAVLGPGSSAGADAAGSPSWAGSIGAGAPQRPTGPAPVSLMSFLQRHGIQDPGGDLRAAGLNRFPGLIRAGGMPLDSAREAAAEAGYLGGDTARAVRETGPNDLIDALGHHPTYSVHDEDAVAARQAWADYQASRGGPTAHDLAAEAVRSHLLENGAPAASIDPETLDLAAHFHARGMDPGDAWEAAAMADPFPGDLPGAPQAAGGAAPAEPAAPPPRDLTPEGLDYVHRALGDKVAAALRGADPRPDDARIIGGLQDELRAAMEGHPNREVGAAYAAARRAYAGPSRELEALDLGRRAYGNNVTREQVARDFAGLRTDGERQQFRQGLFSAAAEKLAQKGDGANFVDALAGNQAFRDKLATVAASPEALRRFGAALDTARQTFTEATRPDARALHGALDTLDAKAAREPGGGVEASRNALLDILNRNPDFARGRDLQGSYNALTGAFDDGDRALQGGPNAVHPDDFAERFAGRTPAGQEAERIAMRNQVDRALGSKPNDLLALRSTLQGEQGWNGRKIASAFGEDAGNALANTVAREETFGATHTLGVNGSHTARLEGAAKDLRESAPGSTNLLPANWQGLTLQGMRDLAYRPLVKALFDASNEPRDWEIARMLVERGASRDEIVAQMARLEARRAAVKGGVTALAGTVRTGGNLLTNAGAPIAAASAMGTDAGRKADRRMRRAAAYGQGAANALLGDSIVPPPRNPLLGR